MATGTPSLAMYRGHVDGAVSRRWGSLCIAIVCSWQATEKFCRYGTVVSCSGVIDSVDIFQSKSLQNPFFYGRVGLLIPGSEIAKKISFDLLS